ncbi:PREDICTED: DNA repair protein RAD51 homolog 3-like isoform X3 [Papilio polytes]|uniref:DNA repair protein RAD51 homolog 3-like isoform X3 n=1 Tax=Papilio polytes TaxID=76194 RepID=UPI000675DF53|nr:PREDICTED: DNA repair protein RAD51 homolog 3-like isoform X3 [Papilio polytes]
MDTGYKIFNSTEIWKRETSLPSIPTFSQKLDNILGTDGIPLGSITELLGLPGTGKTQICLQLCAAVQVPEALGGLNAKALYIDTNTNFVLKRFTEILSATLTKCHKLLEECNMSEEEALKNVHYVGAFGLEKFCAFMYQLPKFLAEENNVVLTNEMSTRVGLSSGAVVGALGDAWAHRCNTRLLLSAPDDPAGDRLALLLKSNISPEAVAPFKITSDGIRDVN